MTCCREEGWGRSERPSCFYHPFKLLQLKLWICHGAIFGGSMSWTPSLINDEQAHKLRNLTQTLISNHFSMIMVPLLNVAAAAKSLQSCPTLCDPIDGSPPGSPIPGILQARTLKGCHFLLQCMKVKSESEVTHSSPTLSDLMDCSLPGSSVHGIFQARVLEWGAIASSDFCMTRGQIRRSLSFSPIHFHTSP